MKCAVAYKAATGGPEPPPRLYRPCPSGVGRPIDACAPAPATPEPPCLSSVCKSSPRPASSPDEEEAAFPDLAAATRGVTRGARSLLCAECLRGDLDLSRSIRFDEAVRVTFDDPDDPSQSVAG